MLNESEKFLFEECGKEYASLLGSRIHIDSVHKGLKNHICHLCGKNFGRRDEDWNENANDENDEDEDEDDEDDEDEGDDVNDDDEESQ